VAGPATFAERLIDLQEEKAARAVVFGVARGDGAEVARKSALVGPPTAGAG
jgi:hypothetical protein